MVHFVIEAYERVELTHFCYNNVGTGSAQYHPQMMLALLIYCYANGLFSSRRIERATYRDIAVRYLTADTHPDHDTNCKFRRENLDAIAEAFVIPHFSEQQFVKTHAALSNRRCGRRLMSVCMGS